MFLDLDGTLWDHEDISQLIPPFKRIDEFTIVDSKGREVRVYRPLIEIVKRVVENGFLLSTLSWNNPAVALDALEKLGIRELFHYHAIEDHPRKEIMALKALKYFKNAYGCKAFKVIYIDDREIHLDDMIRVFPDLCFIKAHKDFTTAHEGLFGIKKCVEEKGFIVLDE